MTDAADFIVEEGNYEIDYTAPSFEVVVKLLTNQDVQEVKDNYFNVGSGVDIEEWCKDNGIEEVPVPFIVQFLTNNSPVSNFISGIYIPTLKKFVFNKKVF